jgi:dUTPase
MMRYEVGDKIIQCKLGITLPIEFVEANELSKTERGAGGFGSTGK